MNLNISKRSGGALRALMRQNMQRVSPNPARLRPARYSPKIDRFLFTVKITGSDSIQIEYDHKKTILFEAETKGRGNMFTLTVPHRRQAGNFVIDVIRSYPLSEKLTCNPVAHPSIEIAKFKKDLNDCASYRDNIAEFISRHPILMMD